VHIFEQFFTTKEVGKGTGLGLATVYGVVKQSGGYIWVYSELGVGTTFKIYLPRVDQAVRRIRPSDDATTSLRGSETILLVEDEAPLRMLTRTFLEQCGYNVLEAGSGNQAAEIAQHFQEPIHLLLTDMVMPGMNGRAIAEKLRRIRPEIKVIFMSGYTGFGPSGELDSDALFLAKPVTREALLRKVHEGLNFQKEPAATKSS
jgi:CheY-like chemotaxis protein